MVEGGRRKEEGGRMRGCSGAGGERSVDPIPKGIRQRVSVIPFGLIPFGRGLGRGKIEPCGEFKAEGNAGSMIGDYGRKGQGEGHQLKAQPRDGWMPAVFRL